MKEQHDKWEKGDGSSPIEGLSSRNLTAREPAWGKEDDTPTVEDPKNKWVKQNLSGGYMWGSVRLKKLSGYTVKRFYLNRSSVDMTQLSDSAMIF